MSLVALRLRQAAEAAAAAPVSEDQEVEWKHPMSRVAEPLSASAALELEADAAVSEASDKPESVPELSKREQLLALVAEIDDQLVLLALDCLVPRHAVRKQ